MIRPYFPQTNDLYAFYRDGTPMDVDCDTLSDLHVFVFIMIVTFLGCVLLCLVETVWDAKRMCCGDEVNHDRLHVAIA